MIAELTREIGFLRTALVVETLALAALASAVYRLVEVVRGRP